VNISSTAKNIVSKSAGNTVFVIGKGPSADRIPLSELPEGLVINLNDSERILAGDIGIFSSNWVRHSLQESGFACRHYLAGKPLPDEISHDLLPPVPMELDGEDFNTLRLEREDFFDESFLLLNALKLGLVKHRDTGKPVDVYLIGFDFSVQHGRQSAKAGEDRSGIRPQESAAIVSAQEAEFLQLFHFFEDGQRLRLHHVGDKEYSDTAPAHFTRKVCTPIRQLATGPIDLADPDRVLIVAELTNNHLGDADRLVEMIELAKDAGADLIKVQKRDVDSFYSPEQLNSYYWSPFGKTLGDYRRGVELDDRLLNILGETCRKLEMEWFCSVLDLPSYHALERFKPRLLKVPSTISNHTGYQRQLAGLYRGAVVVSTGFTDASYLDQVLSTYRDNAQIYLLHCISAYPTPYDACNIAVVKTYAELAKSDPRILPGYSSHDLGSTGCMLAVAAGARMLEKHVKLGDVEWVHFDRVAIDLRSHAFSEFVKDIRSVESMIGSGEKQILDCEHHKYPTRGES
jgi:N-acetylneuraminate synthase